jgi:hypothetical protein
LADKTPVAFSIGDDMGLLASDVEKLKLPSSVSKLEGAYVTLIPGEGKEVFVMVMPVVPNNDVGGRIECMGQKIDVKSTNSLAIYCVNSKGVKQVF